MLLNHHCPRYYLGMEKLKECYQSLLFRAVHLHQYRPLIHRQHRLDASCYYPRHRPQQKL